jgi:hypothetical protein
MFAPCINRYCMYNIGTGYVPAVLLVLAGSLTPVAKEENAAVPSVAAEAEDKFAFFKQVSAIYMARLVIYIYIYIYTYIYMCI